MTSVAVLVATVKFLVRLVDFISLGQVRAKPYISMTRLAQILQDSSARVASTAPVAGVIIHVSVMHCNVTRHV